MGLCLTHDVFFFRHAFSEVRRLIAVKLCHMVGNWLNFIMQVKKLGALTKKIGGQKGRKCKISVDYIQPPTLISNICGTTQDIQNRKANLSRLIPPAL